MTTDRPNLLTEFGFTDRQDFYTQSRRVWTSAKTNHWIDYGVDLVIGDRSGYHVWDIDGKKYLDAHLCGGVFNVGHRNREVVEAVKSGLERLDVGNHHLASLGRTALARELVLTAPGMARAFFTSAGGESTDLAIKSARYATDRRVVVAMNKAYHGTTGLALRVTDQEYSRPFYSDVPSESRFVDYNDLDGLEGALRQGDVCAVVLETVPATNGFPLPDSGYLTGVRRLCDEHDVLMVADEIQTGLLRSGELWAIYKYGVTPDMILLGKGLSGGIEPIAGVLMNEKASKWMEEVPFGHIGTFGGSDLATVAALKTLEILRRPTSRAQVHYLADRLRRGFEEIQQLAPEWLIGIRQHGLLIGLEFASDRAVAAIQKQLFANGVLAMSISYDGAVVQLKPGLFLSPTETDQLLTRLADAVLTSMRQITGGQGRRTAGEGTSNA